MEIAGTLNTSANFDWAALNLALPHGIMSVSCPTRRQHFLLEMFAPMGKRVCLSVQRRRCATRGFVAPYAEKTEIAREHLNSDALWQNFPLILMGRAGMSTRSHSGSVRLLNLMGVSLNVL